MPDTDRTIRAAILTDAPGIARIYNQSIQARDATMDTADVGPAEICSWIQKQGPREFLDVITGVDRPLAGWGIIKRYHPRPGYAGAGETSVYIDRSLTGRGYGTALQAHLIERCRRAGYHHLVAKIWAQNEGSIRMHQRFGYEIVGIQKEIGYVDGVYQDVAILQLILNGALMD